jgi:hypothetical protein
MTTLSNWSAVFQHVNPQNYNDFLRSALLYGYEKGIQLDIENLLLIQIRQDFSPDFYARYHLLLEKRQSAQLSVQEQEELSQITNEIAEFNLRKIEILAYLAHLKNTTVAALKHDLGIALPSFSAQ